MTIMRHVLLLSCRLALAPMLAQPFATVMAMPAELLSPVDGARLRYLAPGRFTIGVDQAVLKNELQSLKRSAPDDVDQTWAKIFEYELPRQTLEFPALYMDKFEVTNHQYAQFVAKTGAEPSRYRDFPQFNGPNQPATGVSWVAADAYCRWAGRRLPTEQEWERAARGAASAMFPWGAQPDAKRFNGRRLGRYATVNVGSFPAGDTPEGLSDMAGNVWEFTSSFWNAKSRVMRGGSFLNDLAFVRASVRWASARQDKGTEYLGFRCAIEASRITNQDARPAVK